MAAPAPARDAAPTPTSTDMCPGTSTANRVVSLKVGTIVPTPSKPETDPYLRATLVMIQIIVFGLAFLLLAFVSYT